MTTPWRFTCWREPITPDPVAVERWAAFCATIEARIEQVRVEESHEARQAFGVPLEDFAEPRPLPVGLIWPRVGERAPRPGRQRWYRRSA